MRSQTVKALLIAFGLVVGGCDTTHVVRSEIRTCKYVDTLTNQSTVAPCPDSTIYLP